MVTIKVLHMHPTFDAPLWQDIREIPGFEWCNHWTEIGEVTTLFYKYDLPVSTGYLWWKKWHIEKKTCCVHEVNIRFVEESVERHFTCGEGEINYGKK